MTAGAGVSSAGVSSAGVSSAGTTGAAPGTRGYAEASAVFNLAAPVAPARALTARTVADVQDAVRSARAAGRPVRVHATGHASPTAAPMDGALLVRTRLAGGVEVDPAAGVARVPAGTRWREVVDAAAPHGLVAPHGSSGDVGVVGYLLRGGLSFFGREVGLAVTRVRAVELVTADGALRRADAAHDPELFWALRGGGGGLGIVTAVEVELFRAPAVTTGAAFWPARHAPALLRAWRRWAASAPRGATTSVQVMRLPDAPGVPPELSAGPVLGLDGAVHGPDEAAVADVVAGLLGPLRDLADPLLDTWAATSASAVLDAHVDPADPVPILGDHLLLRDPGDDGLDRLLDLVGEGSGSPLITASLRQLGGAYADPPATPGREPGALHRVDAAFAWSGAGVPGLSGPAAAIEERCARVRAALAPWDTGRTVPSFVENRHQPQGHLDAAAAARVAAVRARVDPGGVFAGDVQPVLADR